VKGEAEAEGEQRWERQGTGKKMNSRPLWLWKQRLVGEWKEEAGDEFGFGFEKRRLRTRRTRMR
jgi:hypothetical protein